MEKLDQRNDEWMASRPTIALADIRNNTDRPGLNKQPFFDEIEITNSFAGQSFYFAKQCRLRISHNFSPNNHDVLTDL